MIKLESKLCVIFSEEFALTTIIDIFLLSLVLEKKNLDFVLSEKALISVCQGFLLSVFCPTEDCLLPEPELLSPE